MREIASDVGSIAYHIEVLPFPREQVEAVVALARAVFGSVDTSKFQWRLDNLPDASLALASDDGTPIGFKCGYAIAPGRYYSWLGGVAPHARRRGVARSLMELQHAWLVARSYDSVETRTTEDNNAMLRLNCEFGFETIGSYTRDGLARVMLAKRLG